MSYASENETEKVPEELDQQQHQQQQERVTISSSSSPPSYDSCITISPPPPTYLQSSRLLYKNKPYISGFDTLVIPGADDDPSDTLPVISMLPPSRRYKYYIFTWIRDKKAAYMACILFCLLLTGIILLFTMLFPSHHRMMLDHRS